MTSPQVPSVETDRHEALQRAEAEVRAMAARLRSARQRLALHDSVDRVLAEASSPEQALPRILRSLGRALHWEVAGYWQVDEDAGLLRRSAVWHEGGTGQAPGQAPGQDPKSLRHGPTLPRGEGLPGRAWSSRLPAWSQDGAQDGSFDHLSWADRGHLHGAFAVPVLLGDRVLGVVELMSRELRHREEGLLDLVTALGRQLAQFLDRSRAEAALKDAEGRFAAFMDGSPAVAWIKDEDSRYVHVNRSLERLLQRDLEAVKGKADADLWAEETAGRSSPRARRPRRPRAWRRQEGCVGTGRS